MSITFNKRILDRKVDFIGFESTRAVFLNGLRQVIGHQGGYFGNESTVFFGKDFTFIPRQKKIGQSGAHGIGDFRYVELAVLPFHGDFQLR